MSSISRMPIEGRVVWKGRDLAMHSDWLHHLTEYEIADLDNALRSVKERGLSMDRLGKADFPLPTLGRRLEEILEEVRDGLGFCVLRGLPVEKYGKDDTCLVLWGIGTHLGDAISQNSYGDLLGHVYDHGLDPAADRVRGYQTSAGLRFHTDRADITALLCLRKAVSGGSSSVVSSMAVYNAILDAHPEYLEPLYAGYPYIHVEAAGHREARRISVYSLQDGVLSCGIQRGTIEKAIQKGVMPLSRLELDALACFDRLAEDPELRFDLDLRPGDIQLCNNYTVMHARTAYVDDPDPEKRRHMVRLWLHFREKRPVAPQLGEHYTGVHKAL